MILLVDFDVHFWLLLSKGAHLKGSSGKKGTSSENVWGRGWLTPPLLPLLRRICGLLLLLSHWLICSALAVIENMTKKRLCSCSKVTLLGRPLIKWRSQPLLNWNYEENVKLETGILFGLNAYIKIFKYLNLAGIPWMLKSVTTGFRKVCYLPSYMNISQMIKDKVLKNVNTKISSGHDAKYLTCAFLDQNTGKIIPSSVTRVTETGNSNRIKLYGFKRN